MNKRNYNNEFKDKANRKYAYNFDYVLRDYMLQEFSPFFIESKEAQGNMLEMGCYKGEFTQKASAFFQNLSVIEASKELVDYCSNKFMNKPDLINHKDIKYINQRFEETRLKHAYDNIFLIHTLEHLDSPIPVLKKINEWLSSKGRLFLAVPNANAASRQIAVNMGIISHNTAVTEGEMEHGHRCTYNLDSLKNDAKKAGLKVVREGGVFFKPFANFQFDQMIDNKIIDNQYLDGCYQLGMRYPDLCASIYLICEKG